MYGYRCTWNQKTTAAVSPLVPSTILLFLFLRQSLTGTWDSLAGPQADWILNPRNLSTWLYFPHTEKTNHAQLKYILGVEHWPKCLCGKQFTC